MDFHTEINHPPQTTMFSNFFSPKIDISVDFKRISSFFASWISGSIVSLEPYKSLGPFALFETNDWLMWFKQGILSALIGQQMFCFKTSTEAMLVAGPTLQVLSTNTWFLNGGLFFIKFVELSDSPHKKTLFVCLKHISILRR